MKLNLVMIVKNEARTLRECLSAARGLVDEMIVVDTGSADETRRIAAEMGARVETFVWVNDFSAARNYALEQSDADWNLMLDADEILRPATREAVEKLIRERGDNWVGALLRYNAYRDKEEIRTSVETIPRLLPRGVRYKGRIHEQPDTSFVCMNTPLTADHDGYLYSDKGERNLPYLEREVAESPENDYFRFQLAFTLKNLKREKESLPHFAAFYERGERKGPYWRQGVTEYLYALISAGGPEHMETGLRVLLAAEAGLKDYADFSFASGIFFLKLVLSDVHRYLSYLPRIEQSFLHCLEIGERPWDCGVEGTGSFLAYYNLGTWYEVSGQTGAARRCYREASKLGYGKAKERLNLLKTQQKA